LRILHLSDIHIFCPQALTLSKVMNKRLLGLANWYLKRRHNVNYKLLDLLLSSIPSMAPDVICITGDLVHLGQKQEFKTAAGWLSKLESFAPVKLVPGNHDLYVPESGPYLHQYCARFFSVSWEQQSLMEKNRAGMFPQVDILGNLALIGLSSAYTCGLTLATGRLGQKQLETLSSVLDSLAEKGLARIILMHHPPRAGLVKKRKGLLDVNALERLICSKGVELFLFGHAHRRYLHLLKGSSANSLFLSTPSLTCVKNVRAQRAGFFLVDIQGQGPSYKAEIKSFALAEDESSFVIEERFNCNVGKSTRFKKR